jgi:hypothetical protein
LIVDGGYGKGLKFYMPDKNIVLYLSGISGDIAAPLSSFDTGRIAL